jgi:hypothetical protein
MNSPYYLENLNKVELEELSSKIAIILKDKENLEKSQKLEFYLPTYNQKDKPTYTSLIEEIESEDYEKYVGRFISGLIHQAAYQTGNPRPIGELTINKIIADFRTLLVLLGKLDIKNTFDYDLAKSYINMGVAFKS